MPTYSFRGLVCTREQFYALREIDRQRISPKTRRLAAERVGDERRIIVEFEDGHTVALRPNGVPA